MNTNLKYGISDTPKNVKELLLYGLQNMLSILTATILISTICGTNVAAAMKLAKKLGPGKTVVTVLPDTAERYFSTPLFVE